MRPPCYLLATLCVMLSFIPLKVFSFEGPLQIRNLYPAFLHADQPYLEKASMESSMSYSISHSSTYTFDESDNWLIHLDMEITELTFRYKRILRDSIEIGVDIPVLVTGAGIMDGFLDDYHDAFGFSDYGRSMRPQNEFLYEIRDDGDIIVKGKSGVRLADIRIAVKKPLMSDERYKVSIKGDLEIPMGNGKQGFSNGSLDGGVSLLLDAVITDKIMTYWNVGVIFPGTLRGHKDLELENVLFGGAALEARVFSNFSLLAQVTGQSDVYPETDVEAVDGDSYLLAFGGRYTSGNRSVDLSLTEDPSTYAAPDIIINLTYKMRI